MASPARQAAYAILRRIEERRSFSSYLLASPRLNQLSELDRRLTTELVLGTLRWQKRLDWLIERAARRRLSEIDGRVLTVLRLAVYQLRFLAKIPAHAAINEAVELAKERGLAKAAGFVNAVLRRLAREPGLEREIAAIPDRAERLAVLTSHPEWLMARWLARYGEERARRAALANNHPAPVAVRTNLDKTTTKDLKEQLEALGATARESRYLPDCLLLDSLPDPSLEEQGYFHIQDEASQMVPFLFGELRGKRVADLCAAPGGKTIILSQLVGPDGRVVALDLHRQRQLLVKRRLQKLAPRPAGATVLLIIADAEKTLPLRVAFDAVLVDAPCSGLGTLRRNPEIKWRVKEQDLAALRSRQLAILRRAAEAVVEGGRLLYSTCSTEPEENHEVACAFLEEHGNFKLIRPALLPGWERFIDGENFFSTFPSDPELDGFFAALFVKG